MFKSYACGAFQFGDCPDITSTVNAFSATIFSIAWIVIVIFLAYSGVLYFTSAGDKAKMDLAKSALTNSLIGTILILGLNIIVYLVLITFAGSEGASAPQVPLPSR